MNRVAMPGPTWKQKDDSRREAVARSLRLDRKSRMKFNLQEKLAKLVHAYGRHLLVIFVLVLLVHDVFGTHGFLAMRHKQQEIQKVTSEVERLNRENAELQREKQDLKTDPQAIRRIAREELQLAHPGEIIIKLPPQAPTPNEAPSPTQ